MAGHLEHAKSQTAPVEPPVRLLIPIAKVDTDKRLVRGVATAEVLDSQGEIVDYEAAKDAFSRWRGNVREMHQPKAVGKRTDVTFDDATKTIVVESYISKGAPDTWEKVQDGTLSMYSIGGTARERRPEKCGDAVASRLFVKDLIELSLVDNGACPVATFDLVKAVDGQPTEVQPEDPSGEAEPAAADTTKQAADVVPEPWDLTRALAVIAQLEELLADEAWSANYSSDPAVAVAERAQVEMLRTAIEAVVAFFLAEHDEQFTLPATGDAEAVAMFARAVIAKAGARNSKKDLETIQKVHDHAVTLGATCATTEKLATQVATQAALPPAAPAPEPTTPASPAPLVKAEDSPVVKALQTDLSQATDALTKAVSTLTEHQATIAAQAGSIAKLEERLTVIEAQPMPGGPVARLVAVDKTLGGPPAGGGAEIDPAAMEAAFKALIAAAPTAVEKDRIVQQYIKWQQDSGVTAVKLERRAHLQ